MTISFLLMVDENIFFLIFLLVNDYRGDVLVTTNVSGQLEVNNIKPTKTVATSKRWKTKTWVTVIGSKFHQRNRKVWTIIFISHYEFSNFQKANRNAPKMKFALQVDSAYLHISNFDKRHFLLNKFNHLRMIYFWQNLERC